MIMREAVMSYVFRKGGRQKEKSDRTIRRYERIIKLTHNAKLGVK